MAESVGTLARHEFTTRQMVRPGGDLLLRRDFFDARPRRRERRCAARFPEFNPVG